MNPEISRLFLDGQLPVVAVNETGTNLSISVTCDFDFKCREYYGPAGAITSEFVVDIREGLNICENDTITLSHVPGLGPNIERYILSEKVSLRSPERFTYTCALKRHGCDCNDPRFTNFTTTHLIVTTSKSHIIFVSSVFTHIMHVCGILVNNNNDKVQN